MTRTEDILTQSETRTEWAVRLTHSDGTTGVFRRDSRAAAEQTARNHGRTRAGIPGWQVVHADVIQRTITVGQWEIAPKVETQP